MGDGTHIVKCTECGLFDTPEYHSFADGVCVCGVKASHPEVLAAARKEAVERINSAKTEVNAAIAEKAIEDVNKAEYDLTVNHICEKALADMTAADLAEAKADAIAKIIAAETEYNSRIAEGGQIIITSATHKK